jgi:tetratricopeptide (TPR) repeat protein
MIFSQCWLFLSGQNLAQCMEMAESFRRRGQWQEASELYERALFFDTLQTYHLGAYLGLADCRLGLAQPEAAIKAFNLAYYQSEDPTQRLDIQFRQIIIHLQQGDFFAAKEELLAMPFDLEGEMRERYRFFSGVADFGLGNYSEAQTWFLSCRPIDDIAGRADIIMLFQKNAELERISVRKARIMSAVLPGLGQLVYRDLRNGANSFLLTSALLSAGVYLAVVISPLDAILALGSWYLRYYQGGIRRAGEAAIQYQNARRAEVYQQILDVLARPR